MNLIVITEGMSPVDFVNVVNNNTTKVVLNKTDILINSTSSELESIINNNLGKSYLLIGRKGDYLVSVLNTSFYINSYPILEPSDVDVTWINDYANIMFTDNSEGVAKHEIWESKNGEDYSLVTVLNEDVISYNYYTWQNADLNYSIRAKINTSYSLFTDIENVISPLVMKIDESTLEQVLIQHIQLNSGSTNINWGDGTSTDVTGNTTNITHDYETTQNPYYISISGDIDRIYKLEYYQQRKTYGDITKWILPEDLEWFHFYQHSFTGSIVDWYMPERIYVFHVGGNYLTGDLSNFYLKFKSTLCDLHLSQNEFTGNITNWAWPTCIGNINHIDIGYNYLTGDISNWVFPGTWGWINCVSNYLIGNLSGWTNLPSNMANIELTNNEFVERGNNFTIDFTNWEFATIIPPDVGFRLYCDNTNSYGDMSNMIIPDGMGVYPTTKNISMINCHTTKFPRGSFRHQTIFNFYNNNEDSDEIDAFLVYLDDYFTGEIVPLQNCIYTLNGVGMGIPSAAGLTARTSILNKYTAAGKTATIFVNN